MGLFAQQPEENDEWGGLPSEPAAPETDAQRLVDAAPAVDLLGVGPAVESIVIPVAPYIEVAGPSSTPADGDDEDDDVV